MGWWARQDSNLEPRDYENHEIIEWGAESLRTRRDFPRGPSVGNGDRTLGRTEGRTPSILGARVGLESLIRVSKLAAFQYKSWACATEPDRALAEPRPNSVRTGSSRSGSARRTRTLTRKNWRFPTPWFESHQGHETDGFYWPLGWDDRCTWDKRVWQESGCAIEANTGGRRTGCRPNAGSLFDTLLASGRRYAGTYE
jgi:hypothetical protein